MPESAIVDAFDACILVGKDKCALCGKHILLFTGVLTRKELSSTPISQACCTLALPPVVELMADLCCGVDVGSFAITLHSVPMWLKLYPWTKQYFVAYLG